MTEFQRSRGEPSAFFLLKGNEVDKVDAFP